MNDYFEISNYKTLMLLPESMPYQSIRFHFFSCAIMHMEPDSCFHYVCTSMLYEDSVTYLGIIVFVQYRQYF